MRVWNGVDVTEIGGFFAYDPAFPGGVSVAAGDVDGDGRADIITGAGAGGGPHVRIWSGADFHEIGGFFAYHPAFPGGVTVAAGDVDGDGRADIITGAGPGGGPHVRVWNGDQLLRDLRLLRLRSRLLRRRVRGGGRRERRRPRRRHHRRRPGRRPARARLERDRLRRDRRLLRLRSRRSPAASTSASSNSTGDGRVESDHGPRAGRPPHLEHLERRGPLA